MSPFKRGLLAKSGLKLLGVSGSQLPRGGGEDDFTH